MRTSALRALAAVLLFALGFATQALLPHEAAPPALDDRFLATIASAPFSQTTLHATGGGAPPATLLYARDGTWLYAIVSGPAKAYRLRMRDLSDRERIDPLVGDDRIGSRFESDLSEPPVSVDLLRLGDGAVVATATLAYPSGHVPKR